MHYGRRGHVEAEANGTRLEYACWRQVDHVEVHCWRTSRNIILTLTLSEVGGLRSPPEAFGGAVSLTLSLVSHLYDLPTQHPHVPLWLCQLRKRCKNERLASDTFKASTVITVICIYNWVT